MSDTSFEPHEALQDMQRLALEEQARGVSDGELAGRFGVAPTPGAEEIRSYPRAKAAEAICGCTVEVHPVSVPKLEPIAGNVPLQFRINMPTRQRGMTHISKIRSQNNFGK